MRLVNKPTRTTEKVNISLPGKFNILNLFKKKEKVYTPGEVVSFKGRMSYSNVFIESDNEFEMGKKIPSLIVPGENYEFFGLIPINRVGKVTEFTIDYFEI